MSGRYIYYVIKIIFVFLLFWVGQSNQETKLQLLFVW